MENQPSLKRFNLNLILTCNIYPMLMELALRHFKINVKALFALRFYGHCVNQSRGRSVRSQYRDFKIVIIKKKCSLKSTGHLTTARMFHIIAWEASTLCACC